MALAVCMGATLQCSQGDTPSELNVIPVNRVLAVRRWPTSWTVR